MKKLVTFTILALVAITPLLASPSWIGGGGNLSYTENTATFTFGAVEVEQEHTTTLAGAQVAGAIYPGGSALGIGFNVSGNKTLSSKRGSSELDVEDYPLTWNAALMGKIRAELSSMLALELGAGLTYENTTETYDYSGTEAETTLNTFGFHTALDMVVSVTDSLSFVGGIGANFPMTAKATYKIGSTSYEKEFSIKGYYIKGQVGLALSL